MSILAPSILSADFSRLAEDVEKTEKGGAGLLHIDVMDGHFVPNISFGPYVMKCLLGKTKLPFDVHLMIEDPDKYAEGFVTDNTKYITVHQEATRHLDRSIEFIRSLGVGAGVSINPATPVWTLENILDKVDLVLVMSVNPGFGGQKLIEGTLPKIEQLARIREERGLSYKIEIDGGVTTGNIQRVISCGTDIAVAGSAVFGADDICARTEEFVRLMNV
jgi:ribulose-phosphate 3-epimerase